MADFENDLLAGIATLLAAAGAGTYSPDAAYAPGVTAITAQVLPPAPDAALALSLYPVSDDPTLSDSVMGLQVFSRAAGGDPRPTNTLAGQVFDQLHGLQQTTLSTGVRLVSCERRSGALLGQDDLLRWERVDNYYLAVHRPSPNRT